MTVLGSWRGFRALLFPVLVIGLSLVPEVAFGQASRLGNTFLLTNQFSSPVRWPAVAFDPVNGVYLVVSGQVGAQGHFVSQDGAILAGPFRINPEGTYAQAPRVAYGADAGGFLVTWHHNIGTEAVFGSIVRYGSPFTVSPPQQISPGGSFHENGADIAYGSGEFLVAWATAGADVLARRVAANGTPLGAPIVIQQSGADEREPAVGYNPHSNEFLVAYKRFSTYGSVSIVRVQPGTGAVLNAPVELAQSVAIHTPSVVYVPAVQQLLVFWSQLSAGGVLARFVTIDGQPSGPALPIFPVGFTDALGVSFNTFTASSFVVNASSQNAELVGVEVSSGGIPGVAMGVTASPPGVHGNFYPRVAASSQRAEWLVVTALNLNITAAQRIGTTTSGGGPTPPPPPPPPPTGPLTPGPITLRTDTPKPWVFAEGAASPATEANGFQTYYQVLNPNIAAGDTVEVKVFFSDDAGVSGWRTFTVAPGSRQTLNLLAETQRAGTYGAVFQSQTPGKQVYVERSIFWGPNWEGSSTEVAVEFDPANPPRRWYFAEGSRDYFQHYFLLFNPTDTVATVNAKYYRQDGAVIQRNYTVHPRSRYTVDANVIQGLENTNFSAEFDSSTGFVAERVMYWGPGWMGGHASLGAQSVSPGWHFAEGVAGPNFMTYYTILNPNSRDIWVDADFYLENPPQTKSHPILVRANSRGTISLNWDVGEVGPAAAFIRSRFNEGIVVERSIYWGATGWGGIGPVEGTNSVGVTAAANEWFIPEGALGGDWNNYILLYNPHDYPVQVRVRILLEDGTRWTDDTPRVLAPRSRKTIDPEFNLYDDFGAQAKFANQSRGRSFGVHVFSADGHSFIVEHAIYKAFDGPNYWRAGGAAPGIPKR